MISHGAMFVAVWALAVFRCDVPIKVTAEVIFLREDRTVVD